MQTNTPALGVAGCLGVAYPQIRDAASHDDVELFPGSLPLEPALYDERREDRPTYLSVYNLVLDAERHANEQLEADPSNLEAK